MSSSTSPIPRAVLESRGPSTCADQRHDCAHVACLLKFCEAMVRQLRPMVEEQHQCTSSLSLSADAREQERRNHVRSGGGGGGHKRRRAAPDTPSYRHRRGAFPTAIATNGDTTAVVTTKKKKCATRPHGDTTDDDDDDKSDEIESNSDEDGTDASGKIESASDECDDDDDTSDEIESVSEEDDADDDTGDEVESASDEDDTTSDVGNRKSGWARFRKNVHPITPHERALLLSLQKDKNAPCVAETTIPTLNPNGSESLYELVYAKRNADGKTAVVCFMKRDRDIVYDWDASLLQPHRPAGGVPHVEVAGLVELRTERQCAWHVVKYKSRTPSGSTRFRLMNSEGYSYVEVSASALKKRVRPLSAVRERRKAGLMAIVVDRRTGFRAAGLFTPRTRVP